MQNIEGAKQVGNFVEPLIITPQVTYSNKPHFDDYWDASILLVCGGGSANLLCDEVWDNYDFVWSMNHFFRHRFFRDRAPDVCMMSSEIFENSRKLWEFREYLSSHGDKTMVGVEWSAKAKVCRNQLNSFYLAERKFYMHTALYNQLGYGIRQIIFAGVLVASRVDFIGMDGAKAILAKDHAFQPNKGILPSPGRITEGNADEIFQKQYDETWKYIRSNFPFMEINDLSGRANKYHRVLYENA